MTRSVHEKTCIDDKAKRVWPNILWLLPYAHMQVVTYLGSDIGNQRLGDSTHTMDPCITGSSSFRLLVNRTWRREDVFKGLERFLH